MRKIHKLILALALTGTTFSCDKDFLDKAPIDKYPGEAVWNDPALVQAFVNNIYTGIPSPFHTIMLSNLVDEAQFNANWDTENVTKSLITPSNLLVFDNNFWVSHERNITWDVSYKNIRA